MLTLPFRLKKLSGKCGEASGNLKTTTVLYEREQCSQVRDGSCDTGSDAWKVGAHVFIRVVLPDVYLCLGITLKSY